MKPMLASPAPSEGLTFPLYASAKLDGIRCVIEDGVAKTRKLEPVPNLFVQQMLSHPILNGLDGELCCGPEYADEVFNRTQSAVMSVQGKPDFCFHVFDFWNGPDGMPFHERYKRLEYTLGQEPYCLHPNIALLEQKLINNLDELALMQEDYLERGYEGLILRSLDGPYKFGRSTAKQGYMLKLKKWATGEARIIGFKELYVNTNDLDEDALGYAKRSTSAEGMVPGGVLGAFLVQDCETGIDFSLGGGFTAEQRAEFWSQPTTLLGQIVKYKHFEIGVKVAPRFPIFLGFRDPRDMGEPAP